MLTAQHDDTQAQALERLSRARCRSDELFNIVRPQALYERPIPERHRIIFYLGHLEAFDWNLFSQNLLGIKPFHPEFDKLFAFGIDPVGGGLPSDQPSDWPTSQEVRAYVARVRRELDTGLEMGDGQGKFPASLLLNVAIEHRLMHVETLSYMLHQLSLHHKISISDEQHPIFAPTTPGMVHVPAGTATLGISRKENVFGWDNEFERHTAEVSAFEIDRYKVTNGEFLEFMLAGGYDNRSLWDDPDWRWKTESNISCPVFWKRDGQRWYLRTMFDEVRLPLDWPVYVSHAEASAYARWVKKSLPSETQWHRAAYGTPQGSERPYPWGTEPPNAKYGNFDFHSWDPAPVGASPEGRSAFDAADLLGNGWEWTSTLFGPFPGFERFPFYPGYSADFFDGKHYVMKGGSARTAACMLRRSFRNWFQPQYQYVYAGFRCVRN